MSSSVSSVHDWVAVTISPSSVKATCTSEPGFAPILSAKSASDAPRVRRTFSPLPRAMPPPIVGAARLSNS